MAINFLSVTEFTERSQMHTNNS